MPSCAQSRRTGWTGRGWCVLPPPRLLLVIRPHARPCGLGRRCRAR
jgi:hypothetical protein